MAPRRRQSRLSGSKGISIALGAKGAGKQTSRAAKNPHQRKKSTSLAKKHYATVASVDSLKTSSDIDFSEGRPVTSVGKQVDHASAYALF